MKKSGLPKLLSRAFATGAAVIAAAVLFGNTSTSALPTPQTSIGPTPGPSALPSGTRELALGSSLFFVLDDRLSSKTNRTGDVVRTHLRDALVLNGVTVAAAGAPMFIKISNVRGARSPDQDGSVDIFFEPFSLSNHQVLPLHAPTSHLSVRVSAGAVTTAGITDTVKDIFIPYHYLYRMFRKGADLQLDPGTLLRARTAATLAAVKTGGVTVVAAPPISTSIDPVHADYKPLPFSTIAPSKQPAATVAPKLTPSPEPSDSPTPAARP
ncbi:MAG: hypothetical protein M3126_11595 [Candidatus Eremiobacteraeota bacterium]|nr:hypothetical protein [Candidatus Eremiobacteraeota bacterium]